MTTHDAGRRLAPRLLLAALAAIFLYLVFRNTGLGPSVLGDEWSYSRDSRLQPFALADIPSYLYFLIYHSTNLCGSGFDDCARTLNAVFFVAAGPFMFLLARRCMRSDLAAWLTVTALISPLSTYTAFFTPEALYFLLFWIFAWLVLVALPRPRLAGGLATGGLLGAMCLVKLHALFLLAGYGLYLAGLTVLAPAPRAWRAAVRALAAAALAFFAVRFGGGYLLAGRDGLHLLGGLYAAQFNQRFNHPELASLLHYGVHSAMGHAMALALLAAVPLACLSQVQRLPAIDDQAAESYRQRLALFCAAILLTLVGVTVYFTANVPDGDPLEALQRLHMRYYNFALPLLYLLAGAWVGGRPTPAERRTWLRLLAVLVIGSAYLWGWALHMAGYAPNRIDAPELHGLLASRHFGNVMGALGLACLVLWMISRQLGAILYVLLFVPVFALGAAASVDRETVQRKQPDVYDLAARVTRDLLPPAQRSGVVIFGDDIFKLVQANFRLDLPDTQDKPLQPGQAIEAPDLPIGSQWALVVGDHAMHAAVASAQKFSGYALYRLSTPLVVDFKDGGNFLAASEGLAAPEGFGRWSVADRVVLRLRQPLPAGAHLLLTAAAYGPNAGKPFVLSLGSEQQSFQLGEAAQTVELKFHNPPGLDRLEIAVPAAASPQSLGKSSDDRRLGIALMNLQIEADR